MLAVVHVSTFFAELNGEYVAKYMTHGRWREPQLTTSCPVKVTSLLLHLTLPNANRFSKFFTCRLIKTIIIYLPYLKRVPILPYETFVLKNCTFMSTSVRSACYKHAKTVMSVIRRTNVSYLFRDARSCLVVVEKRRRRWATEDNKVRSGLRCSREEGDEGVT